MGATAVGKSSLGIEVARRRGLEIVSLDSMQVYRGMDIGTATPTAADRRAVRHHLIDVADPSEEWTVARHSGLVADLLENADRPIVLLGGTGLYVRAVVDELDIPGRYPDVVAELEAEPDTDVLHARLVEVDPVAAERMEPSNRRRIVRALEVTLGSGRPFSDHGPGLEIHPDRPGFVQIGISTSRERLDERIAERYETQLRAGFVEEVAILGERLGPTAARALGYAEIAEHLAGELSLDEAIERAIRRTRQFARRQERWFRRDPRITWLAYGREPTELTDELNRIVDDRVLRADW